MDAIYSDQYTLLVGTLNLSLRDPDRVETNPSGSAYPDFLFNSNGTTPNSTHNILIFGYYGQLDPYIISNYTLYFRHDTRNGVINWSRKESPTQTGNSPGTPPGTPPLGGRKINVIIQIDGQNGYTHSMSDDVYINDLRPQVIYLDNLTGDRGCGSPVRGKTGNTRIASNDSIFEGMEISLIRRFVKLIYWANKRIDYLFQ